MACVTGGISFPEIRDGRERQPEVSQFVAEQPVTGREAGATVHEAAVGGPPGNPEGKGLSE
jgi:hypothetical protein